MVIRVEMRSRTSRARRVDGALDEVLGACAPRLGLEDPDELFADDLPRARFRCTFVYS